VRFSRGYLQLIALLRTGGDEARDKGAVGKHLLGLSVSNYSQDIGDYCDPFTGRTITLLLPAKPQHPRRAKYRW